MTQSNTRNKRIHFFDVEATYFDSSDREKIHDADFSLVLKQLLKLKYSRGGHDSAIVSVWGDDLIATTDIVSPGFVAGRFSKVRTKNLPGVVSPAGYRRITLEADEGLYEASHWVFFPQSNIIAMEYNQHAPQARLFAHYCKKLAHDQNLMIDEVKLIVKIDPDTVARLRALGPITMIEAAVSSTQAAAIRHSGGVADALRGTARVFKEPFKAEVVLSRERPRREGSRGFGEDVKNDVIGLWSDAGDFLTTLKVQAEPKGGGEPQLLDFKRDKFSIRLPIQLIDGSIDSRDLYAKVVQYYSDSGVGGN